MTFLTKSLGKVIYSRVRYTQIIMMEFIVEGRMNHGKNMG